ncbi:FAD-dependent oxidoreductase [Rhizobium sp. YJ-22]|uniref:NAD(P)/FAD-dependent oxidoreductase n=1 Tax=Rhizobium sp. YJ-22 TaxID=3037556 RepID=UPI0024124A6C|nr:FAD-dependent oxidoreductase [Rhizobium sp. YJ-22]MDG3579702.1 FAD-dependent oxidoreductase [Rhizobium sp. YJ-22]
MNAPAAFLPVVETPAETADVLIVGGGPTGLAAAARLAALGVGRVVLLERQTESGGVPRHCGHSPFGMREFSRIMGGRAYGRRLTETALAAGAQIRLRHSVLAVEAGPSLLIASPEGVYRCRARAVLLATGARETTRAGLLASGSRPSGIINTAALQDMVYLRHRRPFRNPVVVGTELVAMSAILTMRGVGGTVAALIESGPKPIARWPFRWLPPLLGIPVHCGAEIADIIGASQVEGVKIRNFTDGSVREIACDGVLFSGRFTPEAALLRLSGGRIAAGTGGPEIDDHARTSLPGVYAAGNALRGVETAGWCWAEGRRVAEVIAADLAGAAAQTASLAVHAGEGIGYVYPQKLTGSGPKAFSHLDLRLSDWVSGELSVTQSGVCLYNTRISSGPERRVRIPRAQLPISGDAPLVVSVRKGKS